MIYDTALRGVHHQTLLRELGWLPVNRVTAKTANPKTARRKERRVEKSVHLEDKTIVRADGTSATIKLFARGGTLGFVELDDRGAPIFEPLRRVRTHRNQDKNGLYRWYNDYQLPDRYGNGTITVRLHGNADDAKRRLNRTENLRRYRPTMRTSRGSTRGAMTPRASTATSTTRSGSDAPTPSATHANTRTCSASRS